MKSSCGWSESDLVMKTKEKADSQVGVIFRVLLLVLLLQEILSFHVFLFRPFLLSLPVRKKRLDFVTITILLTRTRTVSPSAFTTAVDPGDPVTIIWWSMWQRIQSDSHQSVRWVLVLLFLLSSLPNQMLLWVQVYLENPFHPFHLLVLVFRVDLVVLLLTHRCLNPRTGSPDHTVLAVHSCFIGIFSAKMNTHIELRTHDCAGRTRWSWWSFDIMKIDFKITLITNSSGNKPAGPGSPSLPAGPVSPCKKPL